MNVDRYISRRGGIAATFGNEPRQAQRPATTVRALSKTIARQGETRAR